MKENPTYHNLGDHTETIQIDYDPAVISYQKLLEIFWDSHNPVSPPWSKQYMSIIFFHNDDQKSLALASMDHESARKKRKIYTKILPYREFFPAEDYHQKYRLRSERDLMTEIKRTMYTQAEDFMNSTAVARINGYLDGYGTLEDLQKDLPGFGLSPGAAKRLIEIVKGRKGRVACKP